MELLKEQKHEKIRVQNSGAALQLAAKRELRMGPVPIPGSAGRNAEPVWSPRTNPRNGLQPLRATTVWSATKTTL